MGRVTSASLSARSPNIGSRRDSQIRHTIVVGEDGGDSPRYPSRITPMPYVSSRGESGRGMATPYYEEPEYTYRTVDDDCKNSIDKLEQGLKDMVRNDLEPETQEVARRVMQRTINKKIRTNCGKSRRSRRR